MTDNMKNYFREIPNYLTFFAYSSFLLSLSPILIEMGKTFNMDPGDLNLVFASITIGSIIGRLTSFFYRARFTNLQIIITAYTLLTILVIILSQTRILALFFIIYFLAGYLFGVILVVTSENLLEGPIANKDRLITIATSFFPLGSISSSLIISTLVKNGYNWKYLYYILAFITVMMIILYLTIRPVPKNINPAEAKEGRLIFKGIFTSKNSNILFIIIFFCMFFYVMAEYVLSNWSPTFFRLKDILDVQGAGYMISIFWAAVIIGRILVSFIAGRVKSRYILLVLVLISLASTVLLVFSKSTLSVYLFISLAGLGYSGLFPLIFAAGSTVYDKGRGTLATLILISSAAGMSFASYLVRSIVKYNMLFSIILAIIFTALLTALIITLIFYKRNKIKTPS